MKRVFLVVLLCVAPLLVPLAASGQEQVKLAVMTLEDRTGDLTTKLVDDLTDYLRTQIARRGAFVVIDKSRQADALKRIVGQARKESYKECYDQSCQIPLGKALSADTVLRVKLTRIGSAYQLSAEMVDLAKEAVDPGAAASVELAAAPQQGREDRLLHGMREIARQIAGELPGGAGETITLGKTGGDYGMTTEGGRGGPSAGDGIVTFESEPPGALVEVDGRRLPKPTPVEEFLQLGERKVRVFGHEGYETFEQKVRLQSGQRLRVRLRPVTGNVVIRPRDEEGNLLTGVAVYLDDEEVAKAPVRIQGVRTGKRLFRFELDKMRPVQMTVRVHEGRSQDVEVRMSPRQGTLRVSNVVVREGRRALKGLSAQVEVEGKALGNTPLEAKLPPGQHRVRIQHPMGQTRTYTTQIADGQVFALTPELQASDTDEWRNFVRDKAVEQRTGSFFWMSLASTAPGRYQRVPMELDDTGELFAGNFVRAGQFLTYGYFWEGEYFSFRVWDALIDIGVFELPGTDGSVAGLSPFTNPGVGLVLRPGGLFPLKLEGISEFYWAFSSDEADDQFNIRSVAAEAHLIWEVLQSYVMGHPSFEVGVGARYYSIWGDVDPAGYDDGERSFSASGTLYGGKASLVVPAGKKGGFFLGAGYYTGEEDEWAWTWTADWRGSW